MCACLHVEIEWEIAMWICPYHQDLWKKLRPKFKKTEIWDCPETSLTASNYSICYLLNDIDSRLKAWNSAESRGWP